MDRCTTTTIHIQPSIHYYIFRVYEGPMTSSDYILYGFFTYVENVEENSYITRIKETRKNTVYYQSQSNSKLTSNEGTSKESTTNPKVLQEVKNITAIDNTSKRSIHSFKRATKYGRS